VRSTSYVYPTATLTNTQAAGYVASGFEVALHPQVGSCPTTVPTPEDMAAAFDDQLGRSLHIAASGEKKAAKEALGRTATTRLSDSWDIRVEDDRLLNRRRVGPSGSRTAVAPIR